MRKVTVAMAASTPAARRVPFAVLLLSSGTRMLDEPLAVPVHPPWKE